jgi:hypothetical protein
MVQLLQVPALEPVQPSEVGGLTQVHISIGTTNETNGTNGISAMVLRTPPVYPRDTITTSSITWKVKQFFNYLKVKQANQEVIRWFLLISEETISS